MKHVSASQFVMLLTIYLYSENAAFLISPIFKTASYNTVLSVLLGGVMGLIIILIGTAVARKNEREYFAVFGKYIVGKWVHIPLMLLLAGYLLHRASMSMRNIEDFLLVNHLPTTPQAVIAIILGTAVALTVRAGIQAIARIAEAIFFVNLFLLIVLTPLLLGIELHIPMLRAFVTNFELNRTAAGMLQATPWFGDAFVVLFIFPHLKHRMKISRMVVWGLVFSMILIMSYLVPSLLAFGPELGGKMTYPVMEYVRSIRIADFIETLDPFLTILYIPAVILKISLLIYAAVISLARLLALHDYKPLAFSVSAIVVGYSVHFVNNTAELLHFMTVYWPTYAICMQLIPAVYWVVLKIRGENIALPEPKDR